jgi:hypothetical protein
MTFSNVRSYLYVIIWDLQYNYEGYMTLALVKYDDLF